MTGAPGNAQPAHGTRASPPSADIETLSFQIGSAPGSTRLRELGTWNEASPDVIADVLGAAERFAQDVLVPLNASMDSRGCTLSEGRIRTAPGHLEAWNAFVAAGWAGLGHPSGGSNDDLPLAVTLAVQSLFDRACPAFGMLPVPQRSAAKLIDAFGTPAIRDQWLPALAQGSWGATICVSEVDAGSDLERIRTRAVPRTDGSWGITGEKNWISFGDHDLTARIGHCLLARTSGGSRGQAGLSLFLVPDRPCGADESREFGIHVRRLEPKLGLHGSPTCALGFDDATGWMLGEEGRGLSQMFVMISNMRLSVGAMGLGIASAAADTARAYATDRKQGGGAQASAISAHPDVQRMLLDSESRLAVLTGLLLATANLGDLAEVEPDADARAAARTLMQWLLPVVKTTGGEYSFEVSDVAMQVLGGAGYTREWPIEQFLRDARVLTIFEGTTGIQALDLVERRLVREDQAGLKVFLKEAWKAADACQVQQRRALITCLEQLRAASEFMVSAGDEVRHASATAYLHLAALAATAWIAANLSAAEDDRGIPRRLAALGNYWLEEAPFRAEMLARRILAGGSLAAAFQAAQR